MAQRKIKSQTYLNYLGKRASVVSGRHPVDLHHEGVFPGFTGGRKSYNDYQALPLTHEEHIGNQSVHQLGGEFWELNGVDPECKVLMLLTDYAANLRPSWFEDYEDFLTEEEIVLEHISILEGNLNGT